MAFRTLITRVDKSTELHMASLTRPRLLIGTDLNGRLLPNTVYFLFQRAEIIHKHYLTCTSIAETEHKIANFLIVTGKGWYIWPHHPIPHRWLICPN